MAAFEYEEDRPPQNTRPGSNTEPPSARSLNIGSGCAGSRCLRTLWTCPRPPPCRRCPAVIGRRWRILFLIITIPDGAEVFLLMRQHESISRITPSPGPCSVADAIERYGRMLTVQELAPLLAESPKTTYARVKRGQQPAVLIGSSIRFDPHLTAEWLRSRSA
jgi:hypothetical protein